MDKLSAVGGLVSVSGLVLLIFKVIGSATGKEFSLADMSLIDILSEDTIDQIDTIQNSFFQMVSTSVIELPLYMHLILAGIILLVISGLISK